jgi:hypothetical protein
MKAEQNVYYNITSTIFYLLLGYWTLAEIFFNAASTIFIHQQTVDV